VSHTGLILTLNWHENTLTSSAKDLLTVILLLNQLTVTVYFFASYVVLGRMLNSTHSTDYLFSYYCILS